MAIRTGLSTKIRVKVNGRTVGAIQTLAPTESRPLQRIKQVGTDGFIEIVPTSPTDIAFTVTRLAFDHTRLPEGFGRSFHTIQSQAVPFDVEIIEIDGAGVGKPRIKTFKDCWIQSYDHGTYTQDNYVITENATIWAVKVIDDPKVTGDHVDENTIEQSIDTGEVGDGPTSISGV